MTVFIILATGSFRSVMVYPRAFIASERNCAPLTSKASQDLGSDLTCVDKSNRI